MVSLLEQLQKLCDERLLNTNGKKVKEIQEIVHNQDFWLAIGFMADVFAKINMYNKKLQGNEVNMLDVSKFFRYYYKASKSM